MTALLWCVRVCVCVRSVFLLNFLRKSVSLNEPLFLFPLFLNLPARLFSLPMPSCPSFSSRFFFPFVVVVVVVAGAIERIIAMCA